ncbi:MAG TPA: LexA family transcriptional regulator [Bacteroidales bacterium]|nr:LexA family transcriptional regulator [Bacteroidales bacterium]
MSKISFNIRHLRELKKLSQESLAEELKITRARLGAYEEARNEPPIEMLIRLSEYFHISVDALIKADLRKTDIGSIMNIGENRMLFPVVLDKDNNDRIEVVSAKASAGYLNGYADPEYIGKMPFMELPFKVTGKHRAFPVRGDSMPPLATGDFVVGKYVESLKEITNGRTYIILTKEDGVIYKRVYKTNDNTFELHSDNKLYNSYKVDVQDILELWEFVCCLKVSDKKEDEINMEHMMKLLLSMKVELEQLKKNQHK